MTRTSVLGHGSWGPRHRGLRLALLLATLFFFPLVGAQSSPTPTFSFSLFHRFSGGEAGTSPAGGVIRDRQGNFYGVTQQGGSFNYGTVFMLGLTGRETVLHSFNGQDGLWPSAALIRDGEGNLYGVTSNGGTSEGGKCRFGCGVVFKIDTSGKETLLHAFTGGVDGGNPIAPLLLDEAGDIYGVTYGGGDSSCTGGCGVVFRLNKGGKETVLYTFTGGADGAGPSTLIRDASENLYGSTRGGGDINCNRGGCGTIFKLDETGKKTILYTFTDLINGDAPNGLIRDVTGKFFGVTWQGGDLFGCGGTGCGTVFELDSSYRESVLYTFSGGSDGANPNPALIRDASGNLYGVTEDGGDLNCYGNIGCGTVFEVNTAGQETVLHTFTESDGQFPIGLMRDLHGDFYGTTYIGGSSKCLYGCGVVFKLTP
jgi:uncharacterized repeat protein (TIGR03803 family)